MAQQFFDFLVYFFSRPSFIGIGLALIFGAIWLAVHRPPLFKDVWLWAVLAGGAVVSPITIFLVLFVSAPALNALYASIWNLETIHDWSLLIYVPALFFQGLVREGGNLVPLVLFWWLKGRKIGQWRGLTSGAVAGAGFGILEGQWTLNYVFGSVWSWDSPQKWGVWETFFVVGFTTACCALAGWGLGRGKGWQFYLLAGLAYATLMYIPELAKAELITGVQVQLIIGALALLLTGVVLWLRGLREE